jgi:RND superfamily putative drug exporter
MCPLIHPVRQGFVKTFKLDETASQTDPQLQKEKHSWTVPVSYNFLKELPPRSPSVQGMQLLEHYFASNQTDPITIVAFVKGGDFGTKESGAKISSLTKELFEFVYTDQNGQKVRPIVGVRSLTEPLGNRPGIFNLLSPKGRQKWITLKHPKTYGRFVSTTSPLAGQLTRFDVITAYPPFSLDNLRLLDQIEKHLQEKTADSNSDWYEATFHYAGNTAGIRDLKEVTIHDNYRIQMLVVIAVLIVLLVILRRPWVCLYLIVSVLFGYYVTIGATELIFAWLEGPTFTGLDWKVPIFLFVILVAVGEDYNIYLTTRVFEEQRRFGPMEGLRIALLRTGGIITSCGVIMAGTFISMATGTLSMMQQLGFALAFGVLLDTFIIRTILVPAFFALGIKPGKEETTEYTEHTEKI